MLEDLNDKKISSALTTEDRLNILRRYMPKLSIAFYPGSTVERIWHLPKRPAIDFYAKLESFTKSIKDNGDLKRISEQHFEPVKSMHYLDLRGIEDAISNVLPTYLNQFKTAAQQNGLDWELLAAVSYLANILANIPDEITGSERTKFLLAAYNFGPEGINQAIIKSRAAGEKGIYWHEVAKLGIRGYALDRPFRTSQKILDRGKQAEDYVKRVTIFRDILRYHNV